MRSIILSLITTTIYLIITTIIILNASLIQLTAASAVSNDDDTLHYTSDSRSVHSSINHGDELILTNGNDGGCWDDDECQAYPPAEMGSGSDDLITPRIVVLNPRPSLAPSYGIRTSTIGSACMDDEDCNLYEGSGDDDRGQRPGHGHRYPYDNGGLDSSSPTYVRPHSPPSTAWEDDKSILYTSKPIPPSDPVTPFPIIPKPRPTAPRPTGPRVIVDVPKPVIPSRGDSSGTSTGGKKDNRGQGSKSRTPSVTSTSNTSYNKSAADRTALVIGLVAAILIIIVIVAPLIVFCKVRLRGAVGKGQLLTTSTAGDRTALYQPFVQATVTPGHYTGPGGHPPTQPRLLPASITSASLGHGLLSTNTAQYGQLMGGGGVYGTIGQSPYGTIGQSGGSAPGTLPKKKDNREWYV